MKKFKSKNKIRNKLLIKYILIIIFFYIVIKLCMSLILKIPIYYIFDNNKLSKYKSELVNYTINKPKYMLNYYKESNVTSNVEFNYMYNIKPLVYIYNTHQTEEYVGGATVLDASIYLKKELKKYSVDTKVEESNITEFMHKNNIPFDRSYYASELLIKDNIKNNNFSLIIDLHRDATSKDVSTTKIKNKNYARILFVVGKNNKNYKKNYDLAKKIDKIITDKYKTLSRGVMLKDGKGDKCRYNQHLSSDMILLELGANKNTYEEVKNTITLLAPLLGDYLYE